MSGTTVDENKHEKYGYDYVMVFDRASLVSRILNSVCPVCKTISFDSTGRANKNVNILLVGFGQLGQHLFKSLIMNGQFAGSEFKLTVISSEGDSAAGFMRSESPVLFEEYDINIICGDGRSSVLYDFLDKEADKLTQAVICCGNERTNSEIGDCIKRYMDKRKLNPPIFTCNYNNVYKVAGLGDSLRITNIYGSKEASIERMDDRAKELNNRYCMKYGGEDNAEKNWKVCDPFSRMSSRAAADFSGTFLYIAQQAGIDSDMIRSENFSFPEEMLNNIAETEHLRWNAFHFARGFRTMSDEEFKARSDVFRKEKEKEGKGKIRIAKNMGGYTHACLIPWDELDHLSERENEITGGNVDYKQLDIENIILVLNWASQGLI